MKKYTIEIDETIAEFFEELAIIANHSVEDILSDGLSKQVELIKRRVAKSFDIDDN